MPANSQSSTDNNIAKADLKLLLHYVKLIRYKEKWFATGREIAICDCKLLELDFRALNQHTLLLKTDYGMDTTAYTKDLIQIPSKFNDFSTQVYLSLLKDKYAN